jgi:hypothetical protein
MQFSAPIKCFSNPLKITEVFIFRNLQPVIRVAVFPETEQHLPYDTFVSNSQSVKGIWLHNQQGQLFTLTIRLSDLANRFVVEF